jgi:hypothetical protein
VVDVLVTVAACLLLLAFVLFLRWREALSDARWWRQDADYWYRAWRKETGRAPCRDDPADWWKGGGGD